MELVYGDVGFMRKDKGFTMIEVIIVATILVIMILGVLSSNWMKQARRGRDAGRKDDLAKIKIALEEYHEDKGCYPKESEYPDCGASFKPYLTSMFCDNQIAYVYDAQEAGCPQWFKLFTNLENTDDEDLIKLGCENGCGPSADDLDYNYGVSSENVFVNEYASE